MNILITGATSGIGYQLALDYIKQMHNVIAIGRNKDVLNTLSKNGATVIELDVSNYEECMKKFNLIGERLPCIDIAILNAGVCHYIDVDNFKASDFKKTYDINLMGMVNCLEFVLPLLKKSNIRQLVATSSLSQYLPFYRASAYGSSKVAIDYLFNSLAVDLIKDNIKVSIINPGFIKTPLTDKNNFKMPFLMDVSDASKYIIQGIANREVDIHFPKKLSYILKILNLFPNKIKRIIASKLIN